MSQPLLPDRQSAERGTTTYARAGRASRAGMSLARFMSVAVAAFVLWARYSPVPFMQRSQIEQVLRTVGTVVWPAVVFPWLGGRLSFWGRCLCGLLGVVAGYWVQGQPLFVFTYERMLFNVRLLPYLGGAAAVLMVLASVVRYGGVSPPGTEQGTQASIHGDIQAGTQQDAQACTQQDTQAGTQRGMQYGTQRGTQLNTWLPPIVLTGALAWTLYLVLPIRAILGVKPGHVAFSDLRVSETYLMELPGNSVLTGCAFEDLVVVCGPQAVLMRLPDGTAKIAAVSLNQNSLDIVESSGRLLILDKKAGALHCFDPVSGDQLWRTGGLGTINQVRWSGTVGWFLDHPELGEHEPGRGEVRLSRVDLGTGTYSVWTLVPPEGEFWPEIPEWTTTDWPGAQLGPGGDSAFVRMVIRIDQASGIPKYSTLLAVPRESPAGSWSLTRLPEGSDPAAHIQEMGMAGDTVVCLCFRNGREEVIARDSVSGEETWCVVVGGNGHGGKPIAVLPDRVLLDYGSFMGSLRTDLVCLDPFTGRELWRFDKPRDRLVSMEAVGSRTLVLTQGVTGSERPVTNVTLLSDRGHPIWSYRAKSPAYVVNADAERDRLTLLEGASEQLPGTGWWGIETVIRLSDGQMEDLGAGTRENRLDLGSYRYLILDDVLYRSAGRFTGDYLANQAVMRLEGQGVPIVDLLRYTDSVLAGRDLVAVACRVPEGAKVFVLRLGPADR